MKSLTEDLFQFTFWRNLPRMLVQPYLTAAGTKAAINLAVLVGCTVLAQACMLGNLLILTWSLQPEQYGTFSFALTFLVYLTLLSGDAAGVVVIRDGTNRPQDLDAITSAYLMLKGACAVVLLLLVLPVALLAPLPRGEQVLLILVAIGNVAIAWNLVPFFDLQHRQGWTAILQFLGEAAGLMGLLILVWLDALSFISVGAVFLIKFVLITVAQHAFYKNRIHRFRWTFSARYLSELWHSTWPLVLTTLVIMVPLNSGIFFTRALYGERETAWLGLALQIGNGYILLATLGVRIVRPHISGPFGEEGGFIRKLILFAIAYMGSLGVVVFAASWVLIHFVLPPDYVQALPSLALMLAGAMLLSADGVVHTYLIRFRDERFMLISHACVALLYVLGCLIAVPKLGAVGAAGMLVFAASISITVNLSRVLLRNKTLPTLARHASAGDCLDQPSLARRASVGTDSHSCLDNVS